MHRVPGDPVTPGDLANRGTGNDHKAPAVQKWLLAHPRVQLHFTPTYSSWISQVERWLAELQRRCLDRGVFCSLDGSPPRSRTGSSSGTPTPGPSRGPRPPTRSSTASAATAHASPDRRTSRLFAQALTSWPAFRWADTWPSRCGKPGNSSRCSTPQPGRIPPIRRSVGVSRQRPGKGGITVAKSLRNEASWMAGAAV